MKQYSKNTKLNLFKSLFKGREDVFAIHWQKGNNSVLFSMYTDFSLIELNLETFDQIIHEPPKELNGSGSITNRGADVFFHSPFQDKRGIYRWTIDSDQAIRIGEYSPRLRGLKGGKFLKCGERGYTIVDPSEQ